MIVPKIINKDKIIKLKITSSFPDVVLANLQEKSVVPTREIQEVVADETYDGLSKVTIEPIPKTSDLKNITFKLPNNLGVIETPNIKIPILKDIKFEEV